MIVCSIPTKDVIPFGVIGGRSPTAGNASPSFPLPLSWFNLSWASAIKWINCAFRANVVFSAFPGQNGAPAEAGREAFWAASGGRRRPWARVVFFPAVVFFPGEIQPLWGSNNYLIYARLSRLAARRGRVVFSPMWFFSLGGKTTPGPQKLIN